MISAPGREMEPASKIGLPDEKHQAHGARKLLVRGFFSVLIFTALHLMYIYKGGTPCRKAGNCATGLSLDITYESSTVKPHYHFQTYDEYSQLQPKKVLNAVVRKLWSSRDRRVEAEVFLSMFQGLKKKGFLKRDDKSLCIAAPVGQEVLALKDVGVLDATGIGDMHKHPFENNTFDFVFSSALNFSLLSEAFVSEIERILKPGGHAVILVELNGAGDKHSANDLKTMNGLISLFKKFDVMHVREIDAFGLDTEVVFKKRSSQLGPQFNEHESLGTFETSNLSGSCLVSKLKQTVIQEAEPLIHEEPRKPWITLKQNLKNIRYLPSIIDISGHRSYVYVDVGARNYASSIGSWFKKKYPTHSHKFDIYAIEPDTSFASEYSKRKNVKLLPYAAWIRKEDLLFGVSQEQVELEGEKGMGRIQHPSELDNEQGSKIYKTVRGFDFAAWLIQTVSPDDFVVMKMDIEGTEFDLLPRMFETGAICLVDELFLECHYNRWQRSNPGRTTKYTKSYGDCLILFNALRSRGVLVHQWW